MKAHMAVVFVTLVSVALLTACVRVRSTYLPSGQAGYAISCSAAMTDWSKCLVKAGRLCRSRGYTVAYRDEVERKMLVSCNAQQSVASE